MKITEFVQKENNCWFKKYRQGILYYEVYNVSSRKLYEFPIPAQDLGEATLNDQEKSIFLMRYIRKALEDGTLVPSV